MSFRTQVSSVEHYTYINKNLQVGVEIAYWKFHFDMNLLLLHRKMQSENFDSYKLYLISFFVVAITCSGTK